MIEAFKKRRKEFVILTAHLLTGPDRFMEAPLGYIYVSPKRSRAKRLFVPHVPGDVNMLLLLLSR